MILDRQLDAVIDQNGQCLIVHGEQAYDSTFQLVLETVKHLESSVEALYQKSIAIA